MPAKARADHQQRVVLHIIDDELLVPIGFFPKGSAGETFSISLSLRPENRRFLRTKLPSSPLLIRNEACLSRMSAH